MSAINVKDNSGKTPLIRACCGDNSDLVESLLTHKDIDVNVGDNDGLTALHFASVLGYDKIIHNLLAKGAVVDVKDREGNTPLNIACLYHKDIADDVEGFSAENFSQGITLLLKHGGDPNAVNAKGTTPLINVCNESGNTSLISLLAEHGADVNKSKEGFTPLMVACQEGFPATVKLLIQLKANIEAKGGKGKKAIWVACKDGSYDCVQALLDASCDTSASRDDKSSPVWIAAFRGHCNILQLLIKHQADINAPDDKGNTPVWAACHEGKASALDVLHQAGADLQKFGATTPLIIACIQGHLNCVEILCDAGVDLEKSLKNGTTPLILACEADKPDIVEFLLSKNVSIDTQNERRISAAHMASYKGHVECLKLLIKANADLTSQAKDGDTPLHLAVYSNHPQCVKVLLDAGADQTLKENNGMTPLHLATDKNHKVCLQLLLGETPESLSVPNVRKHKTKAIEMGVKDELEAALKKLLKSAETLRTKLVPEETRTSGRIGQIVQVKEESKKPEAIHVMDIAAGFLKDLKVSSAYFDPKYDVCFCEPCHTKRGDELKYTRGNPPMDYGLPIGWCKFGLRLKPQAEAENIFSEWHVAFHGTRVQNLKKILKNGDLLKPGDVTFDGEELRIPPNHWDPKNPAMVPPPGHDVRKLYFSPSIKYSGCSCYAPKWCWIDPKTNETHHIRVAFQVRIKPGVYEITPQTIGAEKELDPLFPNKELEWSTNRFGVSMLVGLLVKVEGHTSEEKVDIARTAAKNEITLTQSSYDEDRPVQLVKEYRYKTPCGRHLIRLKPGDDCLLLSKTNKECVIMHPRVDDPISLPISFLRF